MRIAGQTLSLILVANAILALPGCGIDADIEDGETDAFPDGKADGGIDEGSPEALGVLALVNTASETASKLREDAHVTSKVATNITKHRDGADGQAGTADDDKFDTLKELDDVPYVGPATLNALLEAARAKGLVHGGPKLSVIFSPQPAATSSNAKIAQLISTAQHNVDVAIYSYSDAGIAAALADRAAHGVKIRFLFDTASEDRKLTDPAAIASSKSGKIEAAKVDVRWVNKILHHKVLIVDGPRDDKAAAKTAKVVMGSANWSLTGSTVFDEDTIVIEDSAEMAAAYQHEFDILWKGSRDFAGGAPAQPNSTANIATADVADDAGIEAVFTSANFRPTGLDGTTWSADKTKMTMSKVWVDAIDRAKTSIHIASTHLRLRPVADALIAKHMAHPEVDIKVYLDQQEWISTSGDSAQKAELADCLAAATTDNQRLDCSYNDFLFSKSLVDAGITTRFKVYSYRWDATMAAQMHSKYMVIDGKELISGSYNLSMNSENGTFENALHLTNPAFKGAVDQFEQNFSTIFETGRAANLLAALRTRISTDAIIPMVFDNMAVTWAEFDALRTLIRQNCVDADSQDFRDNPPAHKTCTRH
ncbi:MAG TPA: phospholipase D-like domain-containing protein [Kofleriaceae bacterium]|nr:phospholipase D-like domain-containing protein [Kofleriaceae bacterium]